MTGTAIGRTVLRFLAATAICFPLALSAQETLVGPPFVPKFDSLTDDIYGTTAHRLTDKLSFPEYYQWKRDLSSRGIDFVLLNTPIFQLGSEGGKTYADNELDLYFQWRAFDNERMSGKVFFWGLWVQTFSDLPSGAFAASQGLLSFPNGGATDPGKSVVAPSALWWEQTFKQTGFTYRVGQLYAASLWGANDYLGDDRATFMNTVLGTNQGTPWASGNRGLGAMATLASDTVYASLGFQDAKGNQSSIDFDSFGDGKFAYLAEVGFTPNFEDRNSGTYKLAVGQVDETGPTSDPANRSGWGYIASAQQDFGSDLGLFAIHRRSYDRFVNNTKHSTAAGVVFKNFLDWDNDSLGLGGFYLEPFDNQDGTLQAEYGLESYWNIQLTPRLSVSPDIQVYLQPGRKSQSSTPVVVGFRLQYVL